LCERSFRTCRLKLRACRRLRACAGDRISRREAPAQYARRAPSDHSQGLLQPLTIGNCSSLARRSTAFASPRVNSRSDFQKISKRHCARTLRQRTDFLPAVATVTRANLRTPCPATLATDRETTIQGNHSQQGDGSSSAILFWHGWCFPLLRVMEANGTEGHAFANKVHRFTPRD